MEQKPISRWQQFFQEDANLGNIPASACAHRATEIFIENDCRIILDLGCGSGRDTLCLAESGAELVGLDAARSGLLLAQKRVEDLSHVISWVESDSRDLPFSNSRFDGVYCFGLLHEFVGKSAEEDVTKTMDEIYRVLKLRG
jgi:ubiquinone/menaquinone biosynthesis C-methylase UbiE